jgi:hypothetical protein
VAQASSLCWWKMKSRAKNAKTSKQDWQLLPFWAAEGCARLRLGFQTPNEARY